MKNDPPTPASTTRAATAGQIVERPEPGLARGRWEAPAWVFWAVAVLAVGACIGWGAWAYRRPWRRRTR